MHRFFCGATESIGLTRSPSLESLTNNLPALRLDASSSFDRNEERAGRNGGRSDPNVTAETAAHGRRNNEYDYDSDENSLVSDGSQCATGCNISTKKGKKKASSSASAATGRTEYGTCDRRGDVSFGRQAITIAVSMLDPDLPPGKPAPSGGGDDGDKKPSAKPKKPTPECPPRADQKKPWNPHSSPSSVSAMAVTVSDDDCPICLEPMDPADKAHPLLCPTARCGYNFCARCVSSLIESSLDDPQEASDGNRAVVVQLHCPQCRGDLSPTIEETLVMRRYARAVSLRDFPDSQLSAAQLRLKHEFMPAPPSPDDSHGRTAGRVERARRRYESGRRMQLAVMASHTASRPGEESIEVDERQESNDQSLPVLPIDTSLFGGLEGAMTEAEQTYVTRLMTSGDGDSLAQAAQILHGIGGVARDSRGGMTPSVELEVRRERSKSPLLRRRTRSPDRGMRSNAGFDRRDDRPAGASSARGRGAYSSLYAARSGGSSISPPRRGRGGRGAAVAPRTAANRSRNIHAFQRPPAAGGRHQTDAERAASLRAAELAAGRRFHPLPARMPRFASLPPFDPTDRGAPLTFADDEWDGSIYDAFARVQRTGSGRGRGRGVGRSVDRGRSISPVTRRLSEAEREGVRNVVVAGGGSVFATHISGPRRRVVIASVRGPAGRQGLQRGDVVTHVNGEAFDGTSRELTDLLRREAERSGGAGGAGRDGAVQIVVNAEECTAEALRLRANVA